MVMVILGGTPHLQTPKYQIDIDIDIDYIYNIVILIHMFSSFYMEFMFVMLYISSFESQPMAEVLP